MGAFRCLYSRDGLSIIHTSFRPNVFIPPHEHKNLALVAPIKGAMRNSEQELRDWSCAFDPNPSPQPIQVGPQGMSALVVDCSSEWLEEQGLGRMPLQTPFVDRSVDVRFSLMRLQCASIGAGSLDVEAVAIELLSHLVEHDVFGREPSGTVRKVIDMILHSPNSGHNLARLATEVALHPTYLARIFRRDTGCSISDFIQRVRLCRAAGLMESGARSLADVALASGYWDHAHFTRNFKKAFGIAPNRYTSALHVADVQSHPLGPPVH